MCRQLLIKKHLEPVKDENILHKLNRLHVKCLLCQKTKIKRKYFDNHINNQCPKVIISCSINDFKCSWKGQREDLLSHRMNCSNNDRQIKEKKFKLNKLNSNIFKIENLINQYSSNSRISLRDQQLTDNDIPIIIKSAIINKQCRILDLGYNQIKSPGILQLAESLQNNTTLKVLSLHHNSLSEMSILYLVEKLSLNNSVLKWLDLESTNLTDTSAEYLSIMLIKNTSLTGLWLSSNQIGYHGIKMLTSALIHYNTTLKYLDLENNPSINDSSFDCLMDMIQQNPSLKKLHLNNCQLSMTNKIKLRDITNTKTNFRLFI